MPSFYEGFPVTMVEAQAAGLHCFVSDTITRKTAITELVTFLPYDDIEAWVNAMLGCNTEKKNTEEQLIENGFDIRNSAKKMENFYLSI